MQLLGLAGQVSVQDQVGLWRQEHEDCAWVWGQEPGLDELVVQAYPALQPVLGPPQVARPLSLQRLLIIGVRPIGDTDTSSIVRDRGSRIRFGIDMSYGSNQC